MKLLFLLLVFSFNKFDFIFKDKSENGYFIILNMKFNDESTKKVAVDYRYLKRHFKSPKNFLNSNFQERITDCLNKKDTLLIDCSYFELKKSDLRIYEIIESVNDSLDSKLTTEMLLDKYFEGKSFKESLSDEKKSLIIKILFERNIFFKIDGETGFLYYLDYRNK